jgi:transposase
MFQSRNTFSLWNIKGMVKNKRLSKSISDVAWSEFMRQLWFKFD